MPLIVFVFVENTKVEKFTVFDAQFIYFLLKDLLC